MQTSSYLIGAGPYKIGRVSTVTGQTSTLFEGHTFEAVVWDAKSNQAFALGQNLSLSGREAIVQLDLLHEGIKEVSADRDVSGSAESFTFRARRSLSLTDGDTIEVHDLDNPSKPLRVRAGMGVFGWSRDERRVLPEAWPGGQIRRPHLGGALLTERSCSRVARLAIPTRFSRSQRRHHRGHRTRERSPASLSPRMNGGCARGRAESRASRAYFCSLEGRYSGCSCNTFLHRILTDFVAPLIADRLAPPG